MAAAPARRPVVPSTALELGLSLGQGANCACVQAFDMHTGQVWAAKIYNDEHGTSAQEKVSRVLAAEDLCEAWSCSSLLSCSATSGNGKRSVLLYRLMDGTLAAHFRASFVADRLKASRTAVRHLLVGLYHLHSRGLCHGDVHVDNALVIGSHVLLADLESVRRAQDDADFQYDVVAAGHVMAQLILGQSEVEVEGCPGVRCPALSLEIYPRSDAEKSSVLEALRRSEAPRVHKRLVDAALAACASEEAVERAEGIRPTTREFLSSLLRCGDATLVPTARTGWELLMRSPSLHGPVEATTALDACDLGKNAVYLDRHKVFPADYCSVLAGFCLQRGGTEANVHYRYWRKRLAVTDPVLGVALGRHLSAAADVPFDGGGLLDLVGLRVRVADTPGVYLKGFHLQRMDSSGAHSRRHICYAYWSLTVAPPPHSAAAAVVEAATQWNDPGPGAKGSLFYLDRHRVQAVSGHVLKGWVLESRVNATAGAQAGSVQVRIKCVARISFHGTFLVLFAKRI